MNEVFKHLETVFNDPNKTVNARRKFRAMQMTTQALGVYREDARRSKTDATARSTGVELQEVLGKLRRCQDSWKSEFAETQYKGQPSAGIVFSHKESLNTLRDRTLGLPNRSTKY